MKIEVDQSGKVADTKIATALAFSNEISFSIYLPATTKRKLVQNLRSARDARVFYFELFAVLLFILLKDFLNKIQLIHIDQEYAGREAQIKVYLLNLCKKHSFLVDPKSINFSHIGKKSPAHTKAIITFRDKRKASRVITFEEVASYFLSKKKDRGSYR